MEARIVDKTLPASILGEGPYWDDQTGTLYWTDIKGRCVHRYEIQSGKYKSFKAEELVSFAIVNTDGYVVAGFQDGLYRLDFETGQHKKICDLEDDPFKVRLNDGKCDQQGRLWVGTMPLDEQSKERIGNLLQFSHGRLNQKDQRLGVANGKGWSPDGKFMYHADTADKIIWRYNYNLSKGDISQKEPFLKLDDSPDGLSIDSNGNLYVCLFGCGRIDVFSSFGEKQSSIHLPVSQVTSCTFGGIDKKTLFITTACDALTDQQENMQPLAGHLFQVEIRIPGLIDNRIAL